MTHLEPLLDSAGREGIGKFVVGAVIHSAGQVLILRRSTSDSYLPGIEELPSGGVEPGEDLMTALARELGEEIGWMGPLSTDPGFVATFDYVTGSGRRARQYTFSVAYRGQSIALSAEHTSHRWIHPVEAGDSDLTVESAQTIREWAEKHS